MTSLDSSPLSQFLIKYNPTVTNRWHVALAGTTWCLVGLLLCRFSFIWLKPLDLVRASFFALAGALIAFAVYRFGMSGIALKNLGRLRAKTGKTCIFSFLTWKSYGMIAVMVTMGITLRHSAVPKDYLSIVYTSMGGSLLMGSTHYFRGLRQLLM